MVLAGDAIAKGGGHGGGRGGGHGGLGTVLRATGTAADITLAGIVDIAADLRATR